MAERVRILAVEDHPVNIALLRAVFGKAPDERMRGAEVVVATTLAEARSAVESHPFDAVILDLRLPDGDGLELLPHMQNSASPGAPVVALTANALPVDRQRVTAAGCAAFLEKPYQPADLLETLAGLI